MTDTSLINVEQDSPRYVKAYEQYEPVIAAVPPERLVAISVDIPLVVSNTLGVIPKLRQIATQLEDSGLVQPGGVDKLEGYALALNHAHMLAAVTSPESELARLGQAASQARETLLTDVRALVQRGLLSRTGLASLRGGRGYRNTAFDLLAMIALLRLSWGAVEGRTALTVLELNQAEALAGRINVLLGERNRGTAQVDEYEAMRRRAYALFFHAYDEVRRAVVFLRWHLGDADTYAPSLFAGRKRRARVEAEPELDDIDPNPTTDAAQTPEPAEDETDFVVPPPLDQATEPGMPGGSPFSS